MGITKARLQQLLDVLLNRFWLGGRGPAVDDLALAVDEELEGKRRAVSGAQPYEEVVTMPDLFEVPVVRRKELCQPVMQEGRRNTGGTGCTI